MPSHYGVKIRKKEQKILDKKRAKHECPKCGKKKVKRLGTSQWVCNSCKSLFAGGAYTPQTDIGVTAAKVITSAK